MSVALIQFLLGLAIGVYFCRRGDARRTDAQVRAIAAKLQALATGMADDMGAFRHGLETSTKKLADAKAEDDASGGGLADVVVGVVSEVMQHNATLLEKLETAEKRIEEQTNQMESYVSEARTDALTELANRRAFDEELSRRYSQWLRRRHFISVLLIDVDRFKLLNDQHGHAAGDYVLKNLGSAMGKTLRDMDMAARYGGEEFAVILPDTDLENGRLAAERVRRAVEKFDFTFDNKRLPVTVSVGLAELTPGEDTIALLSRSDAALYAAKHNGRNRSYYHDGRACLPVIGTPAPIAPKVKAPPPPPVERKPLGPVSIELAEACDEVRDKAQQIEEQAAPVGVLL